MKEKKLVKSVISNSNTLNYEYTDENNQSEIK